MYLININLVTEKSLKYTSISNEVNKVRVICSVIKIIFKFYKN